MELESGREASVSGSALAESTCVTPKALLTREQLETLIASKESVNAFGLRVGIAPRNVWYWLRRHGLKSKYDKARNWGTLPYMERNAVISLAEGCMGIGDLFIRLNLPNSSKVRKCFFNWCEKNQIPITDILPPAALPGPKGTHNRAVPKSLDIGDFSQQAIALILTKLGYRIYGALGEGDRTDLVAKRRDNTTLSLQIKTATGREPPRDSRRLLHLRRWSHDESIEVFPGGPGACGPDGVGARGGVRVSVGGDRIDCGQDRVHG